MISLTEELPVGTKVRIIYHRQNSCGIRNCPSFSARMSTLIGRVMEISYWSGGDHYSLKDGLAYTWAPCMFEVVNPEPTWEVK